MTLDEGQQLFTEGRVTVRYKFGPIAWLNDDAKDADIINRGEDETLKKVPSMLEECPSYQWEVSHEGE
jgi:hypothetical protein